MTPESPSEPSGGDATLSGDAASPLEPERERPTRIGAYVLVERVGAGATGVVYRARDERLGRTVAVKVLARTGERDRLRVVREARALARLSVPNVVQVFEAGVFEGRPYVVMEFVEGESLDVWLASKPRSPAEILVVFRQAGQGLADAHAEGLVHRDLKPANILVGADERVRVVDFGLARAQRASTTSGSHPIIPSTPEADATVGEIAGTPAYLAPECFARKAATPESDQFSFCVALYEALYGRHPFGERIDGVAALATRIVDGAVVPPPKIRSVPDRVRAAIMRGLHAAPEHRWPDMNALVAELHPSKRSLLPLVAAAAAVAVGVGALAWSEASLPACTDADDRLLALWNTEGERVHAALVAAIDADGEDVWSAAQPRFADYASEWAAAHRQVCEGSDQAFDANMACLDTRRAAFEAVVRVASEPDVTIARGALAAVVKLEPPDTCLRAHVQRVEPGPPADPDVARRVAEVREELARARVLIEMGKLDDAAQRARAAADEADALGYEPLRAEAAYTLGFWGMAGNDPAQGEAPISAAFHAAAALEHHELATDAALRLAWLYGARLNRAEDAALWLRHAEAHVARIDSPGLTLDVLTYGLALQRGAASTDTIDAAVERALAVLASVDNRDPLWRAGIFNNLSVALIDRGEMHGAHDLLERAMAELDRVEGVSQIRGEILSNYANTASYVESSEAAIPIAEEALAVLERSGGPDHPSTATALFSLGQLYRYTKQPKKAIPLFERALQIRAAREDAVGAAMGAAHLGIAHGELGDHERSLLLLSKAHTSLVEEVGAADHRASIIALMLATTLRLTGRFDEARKLLTDTLAEFERNNAALLRDEAAAGLALLAWTELALGAYDAAINHGRRAAELCESPCEPSTELGRVAWAVGVWRSGGDPTTIAPQPFGLSEMATTELHPDELALLARMREATAPR